MTFSASTGLDLRSGPRRAETLLHHVIGPVIDVQVRLSRERWTVTTARALAGAVLATASHAVRAEVQLAISEACANAVVHAEPAQDYELRIRTGPCWCEVRVIDSGNGFELTTRRPCRQ